MLVARREQRLRQVLKECQDYGAKGVAIFPSDVTSEENCKQMVNFTIETFGRRTYQIPFFFQWGHRNLIEILEILNVGCIYHCHLIHVCHHTYIIIMCLYHWHMHICYLTHTTYSHMSMHMHAYVHALCSCI